MLSLAVCLCPAMASAVGLNLPSGARQTASESAPVGSVDLPIAAWRDGGVETLRAEGRVEREVWQIQAPDLTTLRVLEPLRAQLLDAGYEALFECEARVCGGFDFRYAMEVVPEPAMHVDLGDYRYLCLHRPGEAADYIGLLVSRSASRGFVQITRIGPAAAGESLGAASGGTPVATGPKTDALSGTAASGVAAGLTARGRAVLGDLTFRTGSSTLADGQFQSLVALAAWLADNPGTRVVLVGHTDAVGALAANIALSKKRARAVRDRLVSAHGVAGERVSAEGVGYLAPLTSNTTEAGRRQNRRVEVVLSDGG